MNFAQDQTHNMFTRVPSCRSSANNQENDDSDISNEYARVNRVMLSKNSEEYRQRRERNNAAVKKSRFKSKQKTLETQRRVDQLREENAQLERRIESLTREVNFMRDIFVPRKGSIRSIDRTETKPVMGNSIADNVSSSSSDSTEKSDQQSAGDNFQHEPKPQDFAKRLETAVDAMSNMQ